MGDEDTTIAGTLHSTEETRSSRSALEANIEVALEGAGGVLLVQNLGVGQSTVRLSDTLVLIGETKLSESAASGKEASSISCSKDKRKIIVMSWQQNNVCTCGPVGETMADAIPRELPRVGGGKNEVSLQTSVDDLADDVLVGEADDKAVLRCVAESRLIRIS